MRHLIGAVVILGGFLLSALNATARARAAIDRTSRRFVIGELS
jgi:hypothetical protein